MRAKRATEKPLTSAAHVGLLVRDLDLRLRNFEIAADLPREKVVHVAMPRDCGRLPGDRVQENGMAATFA